MADNAGRRTFRQSEFGGSPTGLLRREVCRLFGGTAVALVLGLKRSLASVAPLDEAIAEPIMVECPEQHCVIEVDRNGVEQSRYYQIGRHQCELRGRFVTLDDVRLVMPPTTLHEPPYSPVEREFIKKFTGILEQWCSEGLTSQERDILLDAFAWEVELRF